MHSNKGQRRMMEDKAQHCRHEMFADDVLFLLSEIDELLEIMREAEPLMPDGPVKNRILSAVRR